jgi:predicted acetylornithine/succinylornithine family transaminase|tara:strand:- start:260 stop:1423 length:1164 start_codon:yes stop_codon:yes gene_type:complete
VNQWIELEEKHGSGAYGNWPIAIEGGKGPYVWDSNGNRYLDLGAGIGVIGLGHANQDVALAISQQAQTLAHCINGYFANEIRAKFLQRLSQIAPGDLNRIFLTNSGTEAVEAAFKLARKHTGRTKIISMIRAYHGRSMGALSLTWRKDYRAPYTPLIPDIQHLPYGRIEAIEKVIDNKVAAVILEPIQGEGGIIVPPQGYLTQVRKLCDFHNTLFIVDEIQTGMGRTGGWFACDHENVVPDIICSAKMLGGGFPIGAMIMREELSFEKSKHGSTYGGNLMGCRAGLTVIEYMEKNNILEYVRKTGKEILSDLKMLTQNLNKVKEVRGRGFMIGIELNEPVMPYLKELFNNKILALSAGKKIIRLLPPLITPKKELNNAIDKIVEILK